jgi:DNA-binding SARP family transcriptional activator
MEILLLGHCEVRDDGRTIPIGGRRQRAALVLLALHPGQVLGLDWLVDQLWAGAPPPSGVTTLRAYISRLRSALASSPAVVRGSDLLVSHQTGYMLTIDPDQVDVHRFERAVGAGSASLGQGDPYRAASTLRKALGMWRGRALADLAYESFAVTESLRLNERRLETLVAELQQLVGEHPLREPFWGQLMLALYRCGRQGEALATYGRLRKHLAVELGIDPSPELGELEERILLHSPDLQLTPPPATLLPPVATVSTPPGPEGRAASPAPREPPRTPAEPRHLPFVGRERHLTALQAATAGAPTDASVRLAVVTGQAGHGKTRLLAELARLAMADGSVVARASVEDDAALPFAPFPSLVRVLLQEVLGGDHGADPAQTVPADLAWLVPEVGPAPPLDTDLDLARIRLTESVLQFLRSVGPGRPLLLLIDDGDRMGEAGRGLLREVLDRPWPRPVALVVTARSPEEEGTISTTVVELLRREDACLVEVGRLLEPDVAELVQRLGLGSTPEDCRTLAVTLLEQSGGIPLLIRELLAAGDECPVEGASLTEHATTRPVVRGIIGNRIAQLSLPARHLLEAAAVVGSDIDVAVVSAITGRGMTEALEALDETVHLGLVVEQEELDRFRFDHALIRDVLAGSVSASRRSRLHGAAAEVLAARNAAIESADHALKGLRSLDTERAAVFVLGGARRALSSLDFGVARDLCNRLIDACGEELPPGPLADVLLVLGQAAGLSGAPGEAEAAWSRAADLTRAAGDWDRFCEVALGCHAHGQGTSGSLLRSRLLDEGYAHASSATRTKGLRVAAAWAGDALLRPGHLIDPAQLDEIETAAEEHAVATGDAELLEIVCHTRGNFCPSHEERRRWWDRLEEVTSVTGNTWLLARAVLGKLSLDAAKGDGALVEREFERIRDMTDGLEHPGLRWGYEVAMASWEGMHGDFGNADDHATRALEIGQRFGIPDALGAFGGHLFLLAFHHGNLGQLRPLLEAPPEAGGAPIAESGLMAASLGTTLATMLEGHVEGARSLLAEILPQLPRFRHSDLWEWELCVAAEVASAVGDDDAVERLAEDLAPLAGTFSIANMFISEFGPVDRSLGRLAARQGRFDLADQHFARSLEACDRLGALSWRLWTETDRLLAARRAGRAIPGADDLVDRLTRAGLGGALAALDADSG